MQSDLYQSFEKSPTEELFFLRLLTQEIMRNGFPTNISPEILSICETTTSTTLYYFIRSLLIYSHKLNVEVEVEHENIIERLTNLPISISIIDTAFNNLIDIKICHHQVRRELLFTILVREINPEIPIHSSLKRYIEKVIQYNMYT